MGSLAIVDAETGLVAASLALIDADLRLVHSTPGFEQGLSPAGLAGEDLSHLEPVLSGEAESAELTIGDTAFAAEAVTDTAGARHALLRAAGQARAAEDPLLVLRPWLEQSSAVAWVKDLDGRYLYANPRFLSLLGTDVDRLVDHTDAELPAEETIDGPRLALGEAGANEPLQLEYAVPACEQRGAQSVMRFVIRDGSGEPAATCGVAAPLEDAELAREEAGRLMEIDQLTRMDLETARAYAFERWGLAPAGEPSEPARPEPDPQQFQAMPEEALAPVPHSRSRPAAHPELLTRWEECVERLQDEARRWLEMLADADAAVTEAEADVAAAQAELEQLRQARAELERTLTEERERHAGLLRTLGDVRDRIAELDGTVDEVLGGRARPQ